jgi:hypothetical protein
MTAGFIVTGFEVCGIKPTVIDRRYSRSNLATQAFAPY